MKKLLLIAGLLLLALLTSCTKKPQGATYKNSELGLEFTLPNEWITEETNWDRFDYFNFAKRRGGIEINDLGFDEDVFIDVISIHITAFESDVTELEELSPTNMQHMTFFFGEQELVHINGIDFLKANYLDVRDGSRDSRSIALATLHQGHVIVFSLDMTCRSKTDKPDQKDIKREAEYYPLIEDAYHTLNPTIDEAYYLYYPEFEQLIESIKLTTPTNSDNLKISHIENRNIGFAIDLPSDWELNTITGNPITEFLARGSTGEYSGSLGLTTHNLSGENETMTLDDLHWKYTKSDKVMVLGATTTTTGLEYIRIEKIPTKYFPTVRETKAIFVHGGKVIELDLYTSLFNKETTLSADEYHDKLIPDFEEFINNLRLE